MATVIFFRGRNTSNIMEDARKFDVLRETDCILVICRKEDELAEAGDVHFLPKLEGTVILVANGGTTSQQVPIVATLAQRNEGVTCILDVQREGVKALYHADYEEGILCPECNGEGCSYCCETGIYHETT